MSNRLVLVDNWIVPGSLSSYFRGVAAMLCTLAYRPQQNASLVLKISVILCTYNPPEVHLRRVLEGLRAQTLPMDEWELLLIDNNSTSPVAERFDFSWHPHGRHLSEKMPGATAARQCGLREAKGELLLIVDQDAILAPDYMATALQIGEEWPFVGVWGGSVLPEYESPLPDWIRDQVWRLSIYQVDYDMWSHLREPMITFPIGVGMCVRRKVAERYLQWIAENPRTSALDRKGSRLFGYGDIDLAFCALDIGLGTGKSPRLSLTHLMPASRLTLDYFVRHAEDDSISLMLFRAMRGLPIEKPKPARWLLELKWLFYRVTEGVPENYHRILRAQYRGLQQGYQHAQDYLKSHSSP